MIAKTEMSVAQAVSLFTVIGIVIGFLLSLLGRLIKAVKPKKAPLQDKA